MRMKTIIAVSAAALVLAGCKNQASTSNNTVPPGAHQPPAKGNNQSVELVWHPGTGSQPGTWKVKLNNGQEQDPATAKTTLNPEDGPTMFTVKVGGAATFKDDGGLDVWEGDNAKSQPQSGINSTQILGPIVSKSGKELTFFDLNYGDKVTLNYRLNFNGTVPSVDPIIDNGGGTWQSQ